MTEETVEQMEHGGDFQLPLIMTCVSYLLTQCLIQNSSPVKKKKTQAGCSLSLHMHVK